MVSAPIPSPDGVVENDRHHHHDHHPVEMYALDGQVFKSLSAAARHITGTRWNGPKFFGLRDGKAGGQ